MGTPVPTTNTFSWKSAADERPIFIKIAANRIRTRIIRTPSRRPAGSMPYPCCSHAEGYRRPVTQHTVRLAFASVAVPSSLTTHYQHVRTLIVATIAVIQRLEMKNTPGCRAKQPKEKRTGGGCNPVCAYGQNIPT
ncbi:hypothetical protein OUZ56_026737 [Daphnia magna]|uniref:Uncharacterized protein n=1 Tax=Daphnia magna TaxID=35525 RepID=A0ABQ9ZMN1_9CRUS|nr:hypothetical protein OUZ56_026737 [Daphnia magna]